MDIVDIDIFVDLGSTLKMDENDVSDITVNVLKIPEVHDLQLRVEMWKIGFLSRALNRNSWCRYANQ